MYVRPRPRFRPRNAGSGNTPSLALEFNQLSALPSYVTFSRGTQAMQYGSDGTLQYAPNNLLTYSNQADNAAWTKSNSFVQTNLILNSSDVSNASWTSDNTGTGAVPVVTGNSGVAPDGTFTATRVQLDKGAGVGFSRRQQILSGLPSAVYTGSIWLRTYDGSSKSVGVRVDAQSSVVTVTGTWQRFSVTLGGAFTTAALQVLLWDSIGTSQTADLLVWGGQVVQGSVPGDYRATTSAALPVLYADYNGALRARKLCENNAVTIAHFLDPAGATISAGVHTGSIRLKAGERTSATVYLIDSVGIVSGTVTTYNLSAGTITTGSQANIVSAGNGYFLCSVYGTCAAGAGAKVRVLLSDGSAYTGDGSSGIYIADAQLTPGYLPLAVTETTSAAVYGPRFDYDPVTKVARGLLIEEQRTNLLLQSNTFNVTWTASTNTNVTAAAATSPEGVVNAWRLYGSNGLVPGGLFQTISKAAAATQYTWSIYAKPAGYNWLQLAVFDGTADGNRYWFNLSTGVLGSTAAIGAGFTGVSATITNIGNGWYRCTLTATSNTAVQYAGYAYPTNGDGVTTAGDAFTDGTFIYGAQLEAGAFATSYIPTVASTATRNADSASITTLTPWFNAAAGTIFAQVYIGAKSPASYGVYAFDDGTTNNAFPSFYASTVLQNSRVAAANVFTSTSAGISATPAVFKEALAYANADYAASFNGGAPTTQLSGAIPSGINRVQIGAYNGFQMNGHFQSLRYYPTRLPNASLQSITV